MAIEFRLPPLGDGVREVTITRWLKKIGDDVKPHEPVLEVETDKISIEVTAESTGTLTGIRAAEGSKARVGDLLGEIGESASMPQPPAAAAMAEAAPQRRYEGRVSPVVSRMVAEHGLNLDDIPGTGEDGRITKQDVLAYLSRGPSAAEPVVAGTPPADVDAASTPAARPAENEHFTAAGDEIIPVSPMRARIAEHMAHSVRAAPHVTTVFEFDFHAVARHRATHKAEFERDGVSLTWLAYLVHAVAGALREHRILNSAWLDQAPGGAPAIALKREVNIGIAVSVPPDGLLVPVIRDADGLSLTGIARKIQDLAGRARARQLRPDETQAGTFSITNHGVNGSLFGTPIIHQPQCAILGFGAIEQRVKVRDDAIVIHPCSYVSLSFDHRVADGAAADAFMAAVKTRIERWA